MILDHGKNTPRWIVFIIDMGIVIFSLATSFLLRFNFKIPAFAYESFPIAFTVILFTRGLTFYLFKTYLGIVRHTSLSDFQRIFIAAAIGTAALANVNLIRYFFFDGQFVTPFSVLIIEFLLTFFLMGSLRIGVKLIYQEILQSSKVKHNVIIYGAGDSGLLTKRALDKVSDEKFNVLAFVDINSQKIGKNLEGIKICDENEMEVLLRSGEIETMIIAVQNLSRSKKAFLVEKALSMNVKAMSVPPVKNWMDGQINVKQIKNVKIEDLLGRKEIQLNLDKISNQLNNKVVLISGAAGSIGSGLVRQVAKFDTKLLILLDQAESPTYELELEIRSSFPKKKIEVMIGDIREKERMEKLFKTFNPNILYHAAAYKHVPLMEENPSEAIRTNVNGTKILVDLAHEFNVEKFVMVSTDKAVNPTNVMGSSKRIAEIYAQSKNSISSTKYVTTRFGNVLGSNGSVIPLFRKQIQNGGPITVTHPEITRFFMTIPEACQLVLEAGMMGEGGEIFIFDMGESVKIVDLAKKMIKLSGLTLGEDIHIKFTGLRPGEKLYEELLANEEGTLKTHHPQIMVAKVREYDFENVANQIDELIRLYHEQNNFAIVKGMKAIVPEFISKNSIYSQLD